ncbi:MAG: 50S ribosomal protein L19e [Candidatus Nanoarchaeia archaeon]|nr:50S ribosomal protein L19e [Candidatus Nanoarchaeia archaeon]MDD5358186.1 50S ribosomal protein L19e [Candidatus Nanoarchaeia archaeon]MDD5589452.1 50S ribosomal protein L19e [Candidatus Nanoarchaeia archaeon]
MNLGKKKALAARTFGVGLERIEFVKPRLEEIKEAITKQDIRDLYKDGAIRVKPVKGKKVIAGKTKKRTVGNVRKKVNKRKQEYVKLTRKLRKYIAKNRDKMTDKERKDIRKKIRNRFFKSQSHLKDYMGGIKK